MQSGGTSTERCRDEREKKANEPGEKNSETEINKTIKRYTTAGLGIEPRLHWRDPIVLNIVESY